MQTSSAAYPSWVTPASKITIQSISAAPVDFDHMDTQAPSSGTSQSDTKTTSNTPTASAPKRSAFGWLRGKSVQSAPTDSLEVARYLRVNAIRSAVVRHYGQNGWGHVVANATPELRKRAVALMTDTFVEMNEKAATLNERSAAVTTIVGEYVDTAQKLAEAPTSWAEARFTATQAFTYGYGLVMCLLEDTPLAATAAQRGWKATGAEGQLLTDEALGAAHRAKGSEIFKAFMAKLNVEVGPASQSADAAKSFTRDQINAMLNDTLDTCFRAPKPVEHKGSSGEPIVRESKTSATGDVHGSVVEPVAQGSAPLST
ncbi:MAG TPA: hypothetical protein VLJ86_21590 [Ramlibacter sp.]|nr:hypothetical protein [Ramlibacter sp.]